MKWHSASSVSSVEMLMEPVGWGLPQFNKFSRFGRSPHRRRGTALPSGIHLNWLQMDEMAWCDTSIIVGNVNGACRLGFAQIKHLIHDFSTVTVVFAAPALRSRLCRNWPRMDEMASYEATIKSNDVNGACGLGFAQIQRLFHSLGEVLFIGAAPRRRVDVGLK